MIDVVQIKVIIIIIIHFLSHIQFVSSIDSIFDEKVCIGNLINIDIFLETFCKHIWIRESSLTNRPTDSHANRSQKHVLILLDKVKYFLKKISVKNLL